MTIPKHNLELVIIEDDPLRPTPLAEVQPQLDALMALLPPHADEMRRTYGPEWIGVLTAIREILGPNARFAVRRRRGRPPVDEARKAAAVARSREAAREAMRAKRAATKPKHIYLEPAVSDALDGLMADHPGLNQSQVISLLITDAAERKNRSEP